MMVECVGRASVLDGAPNSRKCSLALSPALEFNPALSLSFSLSLSVERVGCQTKRLTENKQSNESALAVVEFNN